MANHADPVNVTNSASAIDTGHNYEPATESYIFGVSIVNNKVKDLQIAFNNGTTDLIFHIGLNRWEKNRKIFIQDLRTEFAATSTLEISPDPTDDAIFNVITDAGAFLGAIQKINDLKYQVNLPPSGSAAPMITLVGDFTSSEYSVIMKFLNSREQKYIGTSSKREEVFKSNKEVKYVWGLNFQSGEWSRMTLYAAVLLAVASVHK